MVLVQLYSSGVECEMLREFIVAKKKREVRTRQGARMKQGFSGFPGFPAARLGVLKTRVKENQFPPFILPRIVF